MKNSKSTDSAGSMHIVSRDLKHIVRIGQVWVYCPNNNPSIVHVISFMIGDEVYSTAVSTATGKAMPHSPISGPGCQGIGIQAMMNGGDGFGSWRLLHDPNEAVFELTPKKKSGIFSRIRKIRMYRK